MKTQGDFSYIQVNLLRQNAYLEKRRFSDQNTRISYLNISKALFVLMLFALRLKKIFLVVSYGRK